MKDEKYPEYIDLLKLKNQHPIYVMAALTLGIDPRTLKIKPDFNERDQRFDYNDDSPSFWYLPLKTESMTLTEYLESESKNSFWVPLLHCNSDLGQYKPSMRDVLYQELKSSLIAAVKGGNISTATPEKIDEGIFKKLVSENTLVLVSSVKEWFAHNNFETPFFVNNAKPTSTNEFMDKNHPEHSIELNIAIEAWQRFSDLGLTHPNDYVQKWLDQEYPDKPNGSSVQVVLSKSAKERIITMINWNKKGSPAPAFSQEIFDIASKKQSRNNKYYSIFDCTKM